MKQYISRFLKTLSIFFIIFPLLYIVLVGVLFNIPLKSCMGILLSPFYYIVTFSVMFAGYGFREMRRWAWYLFIISQILIAYEDAVFVTTFGNLEHKVLAYLFSIFIQIIIVLRVGREVRVPYFFPKIRWWESNPRYRLIVPIQLVRKNGQVFEGEILDISQSGCFIKLRDDVIPNESFTLKFKIFEYDLHFEGIAVWVAQSAVTHPKGVGIKFGMVSKSQRRSLRGVNRRSKRISEHYRKNRYLMSQEDFLKRLQELERSDQGKKP